jgi:hypothetical protein
LFQLCQYLRQDGFAFGRQQVGAQDEVQVEKVTGLPSGWFLAERDEVEIVNEGFFRFRDQDRPPSSFDRDVTGKRFSFDREVRKGSFGNPAA